MCLKSILSMSLLFTEKTIKNLAVFPNQLLQLQASFKKKNLNCRKSGTRTTREKRYLQKLPLQGRKRKRKKINKWQHNNNKNNIMMMMMILIIIVPLSPRRSKQATRPCGLRDSAYSLAGGEVSRGAPEDRDTPCSACRGSSEGCQPEGYPGSPSTVPAGSYTPTRTRLSPNIPALSASNLCCPPCVQDPAPASKILCLPSLPAPSTPG